MAEELERVIGTPEVPALTGLPNESCCCTVMLEDGVPATSVCDAPTAYTSLDEAAELTVTDAVLDTEPSVAVTVAVPTVVPAE